MTIVLDIKDRAKGDWPSILGLPSDIIDGKKHPCPKCGGNDRFNVAKNFAETGKAFCRQCLPKGGDGIGVYAWWNGIDNSDAIKQLADKLGIVNGHPQARDLIAELCRAKRMPVDAFLMFGAVAAKRNKRDCVRVPVYNSSGEKHSHFDLWPNSKGLFARGAGMSGMFLPGRLPQPGETWHLVEGVKDAAALTGLGFNVAGMPTSYLASQYAELFRGVDVIIVPDLDKPGQLGAQKTGGNLSGIATSIRVARIPGEIRETNGDDVRDVLAKPTGEQLVRDGIASAEPWEPRDGEPDLRDGRPEVLVSLNEGFVADQVVNHLGKLGWESPWIPSHIRESCKVFERAGALTQVVPSDDDGAPTMRPVPTAITRERITQSCQLVEEREKNGEIERYCVPPPKWLVDAVHVRGWYGGKIRTLKGIITAPTIRADGSILQVAGWDKSTGLLYQPNAKYPPIPDKPTRQDAIDAAASLLEIVADFPFLADADKAAWLAMVESMIGRQCVDGCVPLFAVTSNIRGSGKSLLCDAASIIAFGRPAARRAFPQDDDEQRKTLTAVAIEGTHSVLFDNLNCQLRGSALDAALTSRTWSDRILGQSKSTGELPLRTVFSATGNNLSFGSDIARRVLPIRLASELENPEERTGFKHVDLLGFVVANRPRFAIEALTIIRAYFAAGCPAQDGGLFGSFENWTRLIRGCLVWCGMADPLETRETAKASDDSATLLRLLVYGLLEADPDREGLTTKQIERLVTHKQDELPSCPTLLEAVAEICGDKFHARQFAARLKSFQGRTIDGEQIRSSPAGKGVKKWLVRQVEGGLGGKGGSPPPPNPRERATATHDCDACDACVDTCTHTDPAETDPPKPPNQPGERCQCGSEMVPADAEPGWQNWDCPACRKVVPARCES